MWRSIATVTSLHQGAQMGCWGEGDSWVAGECLSLQLVIFRAESLLPWLLEDRAMKKPGLRLFLSESKHGRGNKI